MAESKPVGRVVYIVGCWDMFHVGHLWALSQARDMGDFLVVGVCTDEYMQSYKGFPIVPLEQRVAIISAIGFVGAVVPHGSMMDITCYEEYGVNVRAIGPRDWKREGHRRLMEKHQELGVEVIRFPWYPGGEISSTKVKERVRCLIGEK